MMWSIIDADGFCIEHGVCPDIDIFRQRDVLPAGHSFVGRPEHVTCFEPWRYDDGVWSRADLTP